MKGSKLRFRYANGTIIDIQYRSKKIGSTIKSIIFKETTFERLSDGEKVEINLYYKVGLKFDCMENLPYITPGSIVQILIKERMSRRITKKIRKYHAEISLIDLMPFTINPILHGNFRKTNVA